MELRRVNTRESAHDVRGSSVGRTGSEAQEVQSCKSNPPLSVFAFLNPVIYNRVIKALLFFWRDVRVVDGARLESVCALTSTGGSNPPLSV